MPLNFSIGVAGGVVVSLANIQICSHVPVSVGLVHARLTELYPAVAVKLVGDGTGASELVITPVLDIWL